ncbi:MAG: heat-inducible transcriptional repressor HrcA [Clostridiales bacterium]|nr:heat-inducible transcriptional repressor HrcA [Clostridiales bacterium]
MEERKRQVLDAIIKDYLVTAEPVGSRAVAKKYGLGVSPATIRNEMSDLEEEGYIEQPHTSAGRRPSHKGYRYYVDYLMEAEQLAEAEMAHARKTLSAQAGEVDLLMRQCCQLLADLTSYSTMIVTAGTAKGGLDKIRLVQLNAFQIMVVVLYDTGKVSHRLLTMSEPVNPAYLSGLESSLQQKLGGVRMDHFACAVLRDITEQMNRHRELAATVLDLMEGAFATDDEEKVFTGGVMNMFFQPEFRDVESLRGVMGLLEQGNKVANLLKPMRPQRGIAISIGGEMPYEGIRNCSVVAAPYCIEGRKAGMMGVLGPTRMSYPKTVCAVEFIADELSRILTEMYKPGGRA